MRSGTFGNTVLQKSVGLLGFYNFELTITLKSFELQALEEPAKTASVTEGTALDTHSEVVLLYLFQISIWKNKKQRFTERCVFLFQMCSPAQLRQQTEELCAVIDQVLQDPLTMVTHQLVGLTFCLPFLLSLVIHKSVLCWKSFSSADANLPQVSCRWARSQMLAR